MKVIPRASDQFHPSKKMQTNRSNLQMQMIIRFKQIHIRIDLLVQVDQKFNFEMTKRSFFYTFDLQVNLLFISFAQPVNYSLFKMSWVILDRRTEGPNLWPNMSWMHKNIECAKIIS